MTNLQIIEISYNNLLLVLFVGIYHSVFLVHFDVESCVFSCNPLTVLCFCSVITIVFAKTTKICVKNTIVCLVLRCFGH